MQKNTLIAYGKHKFMKRRIMGKWVDLFLRDLIEEEKILKFSEPVSLNLCLHCCLL